MRGVEGSRGVVVDRDLKKHRRGAKARGAAHGCFQERGAKTPTPVVRGDRERQYFAFIRGDAGQYDAAGRVDETERGRNVKLHDHDVARPCFGAWKGGAMDIRHGLGVSQRRQLRISVGRRTHVG